jgi:N-acetyl sugar amidotransferase
MNSSVSGIEFDTSGQCNFCREALDYKIGRMGKEDLDGVIAEIRNGPKLSEYDCVIGLSGGVDSSYVAYVLKTKYQLNPLAIHLDNGWNSALAARNIGKITQKLEIDLITHVVEWAEFREIQKSVLKASLKNAEIPTDHAIIALLYREAANRKIPYIIHGGNWATESIMPNDWMEDARDYRLLKSVVKKFSNQKIISLPVMPLRHLAKLVFINRIKYFGILNYLDYNKAVAIDVLQKEFEYENPKGKHFESNFTKIFQTYLLPMKFGIDKRLAHLSSEIIAGLISRDKALMILEDDKDSFAVSSSELSYFKSKLEYSDDEWDQILNLPASSFKHYRHTPLIHTQNRKYFELFRRYATVRK